MRRHSPYNYGFNNPIRFIDPDGMAPIPGAVELINWARMGVAMQDGEDRLKRMSGEATDEEWLVDSKGKKIQKQSDLGGKEIDYLHYSVGEGLTEIVNNKTGSRTFTNLGEFIRGYSHRAPGITYENIFYEFMAGTGPEKSLISGKSNFMIQEIMKSPQFSIAASAFLENGKDKNFFFKGKFGILGAFRAGKNMTAQMLGRANISFYPVGDRLIIVVVDSKSKTSWSINPFSKGESKNVPRGVFGTGGMHFTKYATADIRRVARALSLTTLGTAQLKRINSSDIKTKINISSDSKIETKSDGTHYTFGETVQGNYNEKDNYGRKVNADGTYGIKEATITIYEGTIAEGVKDGSGLKHEGLTMEQAIGAVAGHEGVYATDKAEINKDLKAEMKGKSHKEREDKPYKVEQKIIDQSKKLNE